VRTDIVVPEGLELLGPEMIEEKERPHGQPFRGGEKAANVDWPTSRIPRLQDQDVSHFFTRFIALKSRRGSLIRHGKLANAFAHPPQKIALVSAAVIDEVSGLADPSRSLAALHDVNLDRRRLAHPQHLVIVEIALHDTTVLQRDLSTESPR